MKKIVGLITEYNPLHNGHLFHLKQAKKQSNADVVIVIMSGNFVQRGEPAILDKWVRSAAIVSHGANLVIELPFYFAVQPGEIFAKGAIQLLSSLGVNEIVFGAEHPETDFLSLVQSIPSVLDERVLQSNKNETYASFFAKKLEKETGFQLNQANDILAFSYARALVDLKLDSKIKLAAIKRKSANYFDLDIKPDESIASASAIRLAIEKKEEYSKTVPNEIFQALLQNKVDKNELDNRFWEMLSYRIMTDSVGQLKQIYQMSEGLEYKMKNVWEEKVPTSLEDFMSLVKSKRYTFARLQRLFLYTLLNIKVDQMQFAMKNPYIRILGFDQTGREYLNKIKKKVELPIISRVSDKKTIKLIDIDRKAGQIYQLLNGNSLDKQQDIGRIPTIINK